MVILVEKGKTMYLLFIDDNQDRHDLIERFLGKNHTIFHAFDAEEAFQIAQTYSYPLVMFFDHDMPGKNGSELASRMIDQLPEEKLPVKVIVHSNNFSGAENIAAKFRSAGVNVKKIMFSATVSFLTAVEEELREN